MLYTVKRKDDGYTVKRKDDDKTWAQYNRVVRNQYVTPSSYSEEDNEQGRGAVSPNICKCMVIHSIIISITYLLCTCAVNINSVAEFDENDEIQHMDMHRQVCTSISELSPSHYLRLQQNTEITFSNIISDEETEL